ncbi:MAG: hypothetical protein QXI19_07660 [Candidatus Caldarchaeum sp.]
MNFLKRVNDEGQIERIEVLFTTEIVIQCDVCDYWGKMSGGVLKDKQDQAAFICPQCSSLKKIPWHYG